MDLRAYDLCVQGLCETGAKVDEQALTSDWAPLLFLDRSESAAIGLHALHEVGVETETLEALQERAAEQLCVKLLSSCTAEDDDVYTKSVELVCGPVATPCVALSVIGSHNRPTLLSS